MPKIRSPHAHALRILRLIYENSKISRSDLALKTSFSAFLVSKICERLLRSGYISETGSGDSTGGRRPTLLSISPGLGRVVGIHLGTVNVRIAVTDITGTLIESVKAPSMASSGPEIALQHLIELTEGVLAKAGVAHSDLRGIGMGISGVLDRQKGTTLFWPKVPQWVNVPVQKLLEDHFHSRVELEDTPRTMAFAERRLGVAQGVSEFVYLMIGAGTGSALFLNGQLYTGSNGFAGEFGHITIDENGPFCSCGNRGCLETLISASTLIREAQQGLMQGLSIHLWQLSGGDPAKVSVEMIAQAARANDRFSTRLLTEAGIHLGVAMIGLINLLNPELIVVGGGLASAAGDIMLPHVERVIRDRALIRAVNKVSIRISSLQDVDWARGAALLAAEKALEPMFLESLQPHKATTATAKRKPTVSRS
jgi:predicted NBD/HSP70 family sugar kinase